MKDINELFDEAILHWRDNKGVGTAIIPAPLDDKVMVLSVLQRMYVRAPTTKILIVTSTFKERIELIEYITQQEDTENNEEFKKLIQDKYLKVFSSNLIEQGSYIDTPMLCICYHLDSICDNMVKVLNKSKFKLIVLNKIMSNHQDMSKLYAISPLLPDFKEAEVSEIRLNTPVKEMRIGVTIPDDTENKKLLDYYNEYIETSIRIFGSFDIIQQARVGNPTLNISANQICAQIALENGWNEHLDMNIELNVELDNLYNPGSLRDRASMTYEIIRNRSNLLTDYEGKLDEILKIVNDNPTDRILIINKRGEFANTVTDFINSMSESIICGNYHDKVEPVPAVDSYGDPVFYKSGPKRGERRYMCGQAQKTYNEHLFNKGVLRVLSTSGAPDKDLTINVDTIIITSPICEDIKSYMYRLSNVRYPNNEIKLFSIFVKNSLEEKKLQEKPMANVHEIVNKCENSVVSENNSDFIIVD